jgi:hypothetical protein
MPCGLSRSLHKITIVLLQHRDPIGQARLSNPFLHEVVLRPRDGSGDHPRGVVTGRMERKATPAAPDLDHLVVGSELQFAADQVQLVKRGLLQTALLVRENGAGVHQGGIEKQAEEVVAQVVVGGNVAAAPAAAVGSQEMKQAMTMIRITAVRSSVLHQPSA